MITFLPDIVGTPNIFYLSCNTNSGISLLPKYSASLTVSTPTQP